MARFPRNVWALGWTSFLTDVSTEMIYPLLPTFLTVTLGASVAFVGLVEGIAESTASLLKIFSGAWSDRISRRKPLVASGYALSGLARPAIALATAGWHVLAARFVDRIGKGIRTAPRDALLADSVSSDRRGAAFGLQRAMDNAGAAIGPLIAWTALTWVTGDYRQIFWIATVPAILGVFVLVFAIREAPVVRTTPPRDESNPSRLAPGFKRYLGVLFLFTLGNSSDAFLLLSASAAGMAPATLPLLWGLLHVIKSGSGYPAGILSDQIGRKTLIVGGWIVYASVYLGFAAAHAVWQIWVLFAVYGLFFGMTEGAERALVADLCPVNQRGRAYGLYNCVIGLGALPASLLMGWLWSRWGSSVAFATGACFAGAAALLGGFLVPQPGRSVR